MSIYGFTVYDALLTAAGALLAVSFAADVYIYLRYYTGIRRRGRAVRRGKAPMSGERPPVSVIVCARDEGENLERLLPLVLEQDYPEFEVIVVNDGSRDNSEEVLERYRAKYGNLYYTSIPDTSRVTSRKKFAITVGVKAAKHEILLFTEAGCRPVSDMWIGSMVRNFSEETEFVLGYCGYSPVRPTLCDRLTGGYALMSAMRYLGYAYGGKPYMGRGANMAYRKSTFFRLKGFAGHLHIEGGADCLMVNEAGTGRNTRIECSPESRTVSVERLSRKDRMAAAGEEMEVLGMFTSRNRRRMVTERWAAGVFYLSLALSLAMAPDAEWAMAAAAIAAVRFGVQCATVNGAARQTGERMMSTGIVAADIFPPIMAAAAWISGKIRGRRRKYRR